MKNISFFIVGIFFGIVMTKSEAISWFRIHEMFRFESFHMYGIIGSAVVIGAIAMWIMKKSGMKTMAGSTVGYTPMKLNIKRHLLAGTIFGLGWAITGCCPGPMYILIGNGYFIIAVVLFGAILGTYAYGRVMDKLPH
ncbi:MAG: YeeE/YedE family protein [Phaeodactylibacter sp.]|nr:YeeE/YedE family protein [Phaeodactylibacter sp.]MCB9276049.1 YeeE/YedE family protein [Lewinellaceae bacterium]